MFMAGEIHSVTVDERCRRDRTRLSMVPLLEVGQVFGLRQAHVFDAGPLKGALPVCNRICRSCGLKWGQAAVLQQILPRRGLREHR